MTLRRIITKLIIRVGLAQVRAATAKEHISLVTYVERARRKKQNIKERARLLALLGKKQTEEGGKKDDESDLDSDSDPEEIVQPHADDSQSDDSEDSSDSDEDDNRGTDLLQSSTKIDIPIVRDIPILS